MPGFPFAEEEGFCSNIPHYPQLIIKLKLLCNFYLLFLSAYENPFNAAKNKSSI